MSELTLTVPMPPHITNAPSRGSRHWRTAYVAKKKYWELLDILTAAKGAMPWRGTLGPCTVRSVMYLGGAMDDDNALARHKPLLDWLVKRGYLAGDSRKYLRWESLPEQVVKRDGNYRITLTFTLRTLSGQLDVIGGRTK